MMKPTRPSVNYRLTASRTGEIEELLRRFYRAEVPQPWPVPPAVPPLFREAKQPRRLAISRFFRVPTRLAIAAAVALLVIGYMTLQTWFPEPRTASGGDEKETIGQKIGHHPRDRFNNVPPGPKNAQPPQQGHTPPIIQIDNLPAKKM
jgi:hypothetical protein